MLTSLTIKEMQIKICILRFNLAPIRLTIINNKQQMLVRMWGERTLLHCWWECKLVQPLWKAIWRFLKKLKIELPYDPEIPLLGIYPKECTWGYGRVTHIPVYCSTIYNSKVLEAAQCPMTDEQIKKIWYIYTMGFLFSHKEEWNCVVCR
jgi:hypothetical protein